MALALVVTGLGLQRVTSKEVVVVPGKVPSPVAAKATAVPYRLVLSAPAAAVEIDGGKGAVAVPADSLAGTVELDAANPAISLSVRWKGPAAPGEHRFAKLTLEPAGRDSFVHVFDGDGDIDDIVELPSDTSPSPK